MELEQILKKDLSKVQDLNEFVMMGKTEGANYLRTMVETLTSSHYELSESGQSLTDWNNAVKIQQDYIFKYKSIYGVNFADN